MLSMSSKRAVRAFSSNGARLLLHPLLAPWRMKFAIDARELYEDLYQQAADEADADTLGWLASAGYSYQALRKENAPKVEVARIVVEL